MRVCLWEKAQQRCLYYDNQLGTEVEVSDKGSGAKKDSNANYDIITIIVREVFE